jgi:hypothetical protein
MEGQGAAGTGGAEAGSVVTSGGAPMSAHDAENRQARSFDEGSGGSADATQPGAQDEGTGNHSRSSQGSLLHNSPGSGAD